MDLLCSSCQITFSNDPAYKLHYKSEFHRYNIARKMINLSPVSEEQYNTKFAAITNTDALVRQPKALYHCCGKEFKSSNTYETHLNSKLHKTYKEPVATLSVKSTESSLKNQNACLFCEEVMESLDACIQHMTLHGFFIREKESVIDMKGLLKALSEQINKNFTCLHCFQTFKCSESTRNHMLDKGHCFMPQQEYKILSKYYDHTKKLDLIIEQQQQRMLAIQNPQTFMIKNDDIVEANQESEDEDWEDEIPDNKEQKEEAQILDEETRRKHLKKQLNQINSFKAKLTKNGELLLPGGKILGHRVYRKYYKQNHFPIPQRKPEQEGIEAGSEENQVVASNNLILGKLGHIYYNKQRAEKHMLTRIGMSNNLIIRRWLRMSV